MSATSRRPSAPVRGDRTYGGGGGDTEALCARNAELEGENARLRGLLREVL